MRLQDDETKHCALWIALLHQGRQSFAIEQQKGAHTYRDVCISNIEDRAEENKRLSAHKGNKRGPSGFYQREIEHINHLAHKHRGISRAKRHELGQIGRAHV